MNELFQRPANYWLRHADRHKQSGDLIRAAVLQRHAVRAEPGSDAARMQYALTLRQLHCYEASSREAFCALADNPAQADLYGLIGCNMLSMGLRREGLDALGYYMTTAGYAVAPWHEEACSYADVYDDPAPQKQRRARLKGLLRIAARRLASGDLAGAQRALERSQKPPYRGRHAGRELLWSALCLNSGRRQESIIHLKRALDGSAPSVVTLASAAVLSRRIGDLRAARVLLLHAAMRAHAPSSMQLVCHTADGLAMLPIAQAMLSRALRRYPSRCPILYDLCVCALKTGRIQDAARYIHLCREIDPDDVPSEWLFARVMDWQHRELSPEALRRAGKGLSFFGSCTESEVNAIAQPFWDALPNGPAALGEALFQDARLRRRLMFLLTLPLEWPVPLLQLIGVHLPPPQREALLREVLMQHPSEDAAKRWAMSALQRMDAPAPYACWTGGRFLLVDPERLNAPVPTFRQRFLTRFIRRFGRVCGSQSIPWALQTISRMSHSQQCRLIGDTWKVWPLAMTIRWNALCGLPPVSIPAATMSTLRLNALKDALRTLHDID